VEAELPEPEPPPHPRPNPHAHRSAPGRGSLRGGGQPTSARARRRRCRYRDSPSSSCWRCPRCLPRASRGGRRAPRRAKALIARADRCGPPHRGDDTPGRRSRGSILPWDDCEFGSIWCTTCASRLVDPDAPSSEQRQARDPDTSTGSSTASSPTGALLSRRCDPRAVRWGWRSPAWVDRTASSTTTPTFPRS